MDASTSYGTVPTAYLYERDRSFHERDKLEYELTVRQEPKQARMCGVGADRRPIDPPPIIQLRVIDPRTRQPPSPANPETEDDPNYAHSFLQNPYYFMFASLAKPDDDTELHWLKDGKTRCTTGSVVSSLYHLKDTENRNEDAGFFVFPDLSVRTEGSYRLKLSLFEVVGNTVRHCKSIYSAPFYVYTAKKFPGMEESTPLSCSLADQGIKIRIRKDIRVRKRPIAALATPLDSGQGSSEYRKIEDEHGEDDAHQQVLPPSQITPAVAKRPRHGTLTGSLNLASGPPSSSTTAGELTPHTPSSASTGSIALSGLPAWPTASTLDPMLGVASAPGGIELTASTLPHQHSHSAMGSTHSGGTVGVGMTIAPPPGAQLLAAGEPGSGSSTSRRPGPQPLSSSSTPPSYQSSSAGGFSDRMNYESSRPVYDANARSASYDQQRSIGGSAGYEGGNGRSGYDNGRNGYENASGRTGFDPHHQRPSYDSRGGYDSQTPTRGPYDANTEAHGQRATYSTPYDGPHGPPAQAYQEGPNHGFSHSPNNPHPHQQTPANYLHPSSNQTYPQASSHTHNQGQYPPPPRSQYPASAPAHTYPGSYSHQAQGRYESYTPSSANGSANESAHGGGAYYDTPSSSAPHPSSSPSSHTHPHAYYPNNTQTSSVPPAPSLTHSQSYSSSASGGSQYEYNAQGQNEYYQHPQAHTHSSTNSGRMLSPGPGPSSNNSTSRYAPTLPPSGSAYSSGISGPPSASAWGPNASQAHGHQQEMIHLAPLRHAGASTGGAASSPSPSSPRTGTTPSGGPGGYPGLIQLSRAPFEQSAGRGGGLSGVGVPGKKSVLSIGSIISEGA